MSNPTRAALQIINNKKSKGEPMYMLEEVFFSSVCLDGSKVLENAENYDKFNNPQRAYHKDGYYRFNVPELWFTSTCNNKAIALRRLDCRAKSYHVILRLHVTRSPNGSGKALGRDYEVNFNFMPSEDIEIICSRICQEFNVQMDMYMQHTKGISDQYNYVHLCFNHDDEENEITFYMTKTLPQTLYYNFTWNLEDVNGNLAKIMNVNDIPINTHDIGIDNGYIFPNVWNRRELFIHASFVNGTSFNYLGRTGEFYTKPSKTYRFNGGSPEIYFRLSFDGRNPQVYTECYFIVDLAFIYNDNRYFGE